MFSGEAPIHRVSRLIFFLKKFGIFKINPYLCSMKKEFGKWLMDIAKYMVTALLLSTIFADMDEPIILYSVFVLTPIVLGLGLYWVNEGKKEEKIKIKKR